MANSYAGGLNKTDFFAVNSVGTGLVKTTALTTAPTTTALTASSDAFLSAVQNYNTGINPVRLNKGVELTFDQDKFSGSVLNACDTYQAGDTAATTEYYEDASEAPSITVTGTTVNNFVSITYLRADPDEPTKTMVLITHGNFKEGSGALSLKKGERIKPKVDTVSKATTAILAIPAAAFDSTKVTGALTCIALGKEFTRVNLTTV